MEAASRVLYYSNINVEGVLVEPPEEEMTGNNPFAKFRLSKALGNVIRRPGAFNRANILFDRFYYEYGPIKEGLAGMNKNMVIQKLLVQTPKFKRLTMKQWNPTDTKMDCMFSLRSGNNKSEADDFVVKFIRPLEDRVLSQVGASYYKKWFKSAEPLSLEDMRLQLKSCIKPSSDPARYPDSFKATVNLTNDGSNVYGCDVYDQNCNKRGLAELKQAIENGAEVQAIVEFSNVWAMGATRMIGVSAVMRSVQYFPVDRLRGYSFNSCVTAMAAPVVTEQQAEPAMAFC